MRRDAVGLSRRAIFAAVMLTPLTSIKGDIAVATRADDLTDLFQPAPAGASQPMTYRQGVIIAWNQQTAENIVHVGGTDLVNLPILNSSEALILSPGDVVGIVVVGWTMAILGRLTIPGTPAAASALNAITTEAAEVAAGESTTSGTWTDLATFGPTVDVVVRPSGRLLTIVSSSIVSSGNASFGSTGVELSGANTEAPVYTEALFKDGLEAQIAASRVALHTGLNPGLTTVTQKYLSDGVNAMFFQGRSVVAIPL